MANVADNDVKLAVGYLRNLARSFTDIPKGLDPTFYHTLSYDGDMAEGERLHALIARLDACSATEDASLGRTATPADKANPNIVRGPDGSNVVKVRYSSGPTPGDAARDDGGAE